MVTYIPICLPGKQHKRIAAGFATEEKDKTSLQVREVSKLEYFNKDRFDYE